MFLSKVQIVSSLRWEDPGKIHRALSYAFPEDLPDDERVLWRKEGDSLLVQSMYPPVWRTVRDLEQPQMKRIQLDELLREGERYSFCLRANTTRNVYQENDDGTPIRGKVIGLYAVPEQREWLISRAGKFGMEMLSVQVTLSDGLQFWHDDHRVTLAVAQFDGVLQVNDVEALGRAVQDGVGPAKAFGCGLLSLAPLR